MPRRKTEKLSLDFCVFYLPINRLIDTPKRHNPSLPTKKNRLSVLGTHPRFHKSARLIERIVIARVKSRPIVIPRTPSPPASSRFVVASCRAVKNEINQRKFCSSSGWLITNISNLYVLFLQGRSLARGARWHPSIRWRGFQRAMGSNSLTRPKAKWLNATTQQHTACGQKHTKLRESGCHRPSVSTALRIRKCRRWAVENDWEDDTGRNSGESCNLNNSSLISTFQNNPLHHVVSGWNLFLTLQHYPMIARWPGDFLSRIGNDVPFSHLELR